MKSEEILFKDICLSISDGDHLPPPKVEKGIPFITISNITEQNMLDFTNTLFVPLDYYEKLDDKRKAVKDDILYSVVGSFGKPVLIKKNNKFAFQRHIAILRPNKEKVNPAFLYYKMSSKAFYKIADTIALGAAQRTITLTALRNLKISLPDIDTQTKIASILSRYDDLIENYQQQIKLLEEAAQRLYKEWFIDLHFPGYENTKITDGVPEGWEKKSAESIYPITIGKTPPRSNKECFTESEGVPWVSISDMKDSIYIYKTSEYLTNEAVAKYNIKIIPSNTVLLSFKLTVGRVSFSTMDLCTNEAIAHFPIKDENLKEYTYLYLKNYKYDSLGNTSAISKAINSTIVKHMKILLPSKEVLHEFSRNTKNIFDNIKNLSSQITLLTEARDRLLPKLMSGEIEI